MNSQKNKFLIVLAGPTAVGKTSLAVQLAKDLHCEIISADSRQFFKELAVGTAKPTNEEMGGVVHHFVDFISVKQEFSAGKFESETSKLLQKIFAKNSCVIMSGGSGLYIQAVCDGMNDIPDVNPKFREALYDELETHGLSVLLEELRIKDHEYYKTVDHKNPQRIIRALEICRGAGKPYSSFRGDNRTGRDYKIIKIGLDRDREELFNRIDRRMDMMIKNGLFEEAERLSENRHLNALKTVGYNEVFAFLDGDYDRQEALRLLKRNSRRYAKRQLTWFKKDPEFVWFHPDDTIKILSYIHKKMKE